MSNTTSGAGTPNEPPKEAPFFYMADVLGEMLDRAEAAHHAKATGKPLGPMSGFPALDAELGGYFTSGLHGVTGNAGAGKTAFVLQIAARCQFPALFVTTEMPPVELLRRLIARVTGTPANSLKDGSTTRSRGGGTGA